MMEADMKTKSGYLMMFAVLAGLFLAWQFRGSFILVAKAASETHAELSEVCEPKLTSQGS